MTEFHYDKSASRLQLSGALTFASVPDFMEQVEKSAVGPVLCLDATGLDQVDSAGIACLLWLKGRNSRGSGFRIDHPGAQLQKLITVTGLETAFSTGN